MILCRDWHSIIIATKIVKILINLPYPLLFLGLVLTEQFLDATD